MGLQLPADLIPNPGDVPSIALEIQCETPFVVVFIGRSGSSHLQSLLNQHDGIACRGEIVTRKLKHEGWEAEYGDRSFAIVKALRRVYGERPPAARGFEYKHSEFRDYPEVAKALWAERRRMRCIFLERRNNLRGALSLQNFQRVRSETGSANLPVESGVALGKLTADIPRAIADAAQREADNRALAAYAEGFDRRLHIVYEDLVANEAETLAQCFEFLDVGGMPAETPIVHRLKRISASRLEDYVENFAELRAAAIEAGMERYLTDDADACAAS